MSSVSVAAQAPAQGRPERPGPAHVVGLVVVRGGGASMRQWRLPRRTTATVGRRERHGLVLPAPWAPADAATFTAAEDGWLVTNAARATMRVENDWVLGGAASYRPGAVVMLQRGEHRLQWSGVEHPLSVSVSVRTRRLDDVRIPYAVDSIVDAGEAGLRSSLGVTDAPMSASLRYRLAVLFRHLVEGEPEPPQVIARRAEFLGLTEADLLALAHRYRRRLNAVCGTDLQSLLELGEHLVVETGQLGRADLDP